MCLEHVSQSKGHIAAQQVYFAKDCIGEEVQNGLKELKNGEVGLRRADLVEQDGKLFCPDCKCPDRKCWSWIVELQSPHVYIASFSDICC